MTDAKYIRGYCWKCHRRTTHKDNQNNFICIECTMKSIDNSFDEREKDIITNL